MPSCLRRIVICGSLSAVATLAACRSEPTAPAKPGPPATLELLSVSGLSGIAGSALSSPIVIRVTDANARAVPGVNVAFSVSKGNGSVAPALAPTDTAGKAQTTFVLGTTAGVNEVTAAVSGVVTTIKISAQGSPGPVTSVAVDTHRLRLRVGTDTGHVALQALDQYGNPVAGLPSWTPRDPSLVTVDSTGSVHALRRGGATYVVGTVGGKSDSVYVIVMAPGDSPCTWVATPITLAIGQVITGLSDNTCIHAATAGSEYTVMPYFASTVASSTLQVELLGDGLGTFATADLLASRTFRASLISRSPAEAAVVRDDAFDARLRAREREEMPAHVADARAWYRARPNASPAARTATGGVANASVEAVPNVGDLIPLNANANDYCTNPIVRTGRVEAVTNKAIVVADTGNPAGGFVTADYQSVGVTFDTLVNDLDTKAFGDPSDIDNNGRVIIFFTRAVNELTPANPSAIVLGFYYSRDLLPKIAPSGNCPGSNVAEMFYMLVPDPTGVVNGNKQSVAFVLSVTTGTVAHEFQHLINASRRLYVNHAASSSEETWLNEGLSHIAEELLFFRESGIPPRQNIDGPALQPPAVRGAWDLYQQNNFRRYRTYLRATALHAPIGASDGDDALEVRGAIQSFLRYAADHRAATDGDFWFQLVNSPTTGVNNLTAVLGADPLPMMHDWAMSVYLDDLLPGLDARYTQPSWNTRSLAPVVGSTFPLAVISLFDGSAAPVTLRGGGIAFLRFTVPVGQSALLTATSSGQPLPSLIQLAIVRTK